MPLVYLACPFTHHDPCVEEYRFREATKCTLYLMHKGICVFSPITYSKPLVNYGAPHHWTFWKRQDIPILELARELYILTLDGWKTSVGVTDEIATAQAKGIPISALIRKGDDYELAEYLDGEVVAAHEAEEGEI